jgi:hypothetical protein
MAVLTARQTKAAQLAAELGRCSGTWVITPLPLADYSHLRFQVLAEERDSVITELCQSGWTPRFVQNHPRYCGDGLKPGYLYEIEIEKQRYSVPTDNPKVEGEMADKAKRLEKKKADEYVAQFRKSAGLDR